MTASLLEPLLIKAQPIYQAYSKNGMDIRLVGGCVRDALLGKIAQDIDLATPALPSQGMSLLKGLGFTCIPTGIDHGTFTVVIDHQPFEITTLRQDLETDGRYATIAFTDNWKMDASRRDLTINALFADFKGKIYDYFEGIEDLKKGHIRFIGNAEMRIQEDYLRLLRLFRFHAWYGKCPLDSPTLQICRSYANHLFLLSKERITKEILRLLEASNPFSTLQQMAESAILPNLFSLSFLPFLHRLLSAEQELSIPPFSLRRFAVFSPDLSFLRLSNADTSYFTRQSIFQQENLLKAPQRNYLLSLYPKKEIQDALLLYYARNADFSFSALQEIINEINTAPFPSFPLTGNHLQHLGLAPGPQFKIILDHCRRWWAENNCQPSYPDCIKWVTQHYPLLFKK